MCCRQPEAVLSRKAVAHLSYSTPLTSRFRIEADVVSEPQFVLMRSGRSEAVVAGALEEEAVLLEARQARRPPRHQSTHLVSRVSLAV